MIGVANGPAAIGRPARATGLVIADDPGLAIQIGKR
jgi:hypothetical protein